MFKLTKLSMMVDLWRADQHQVSGPKENMWARYTSQETSFNARNMSRVQVVRVASLFPTKPTADSTLCLGSPVFDRLVKLVNGVVKLLASL